MNLSANDPQTVSSPTLSQTACEVRVVWEALCSVMSRRPAPRARRASRLVMVIPGFLAADAHTWPIRRYLTGCGFDVHPWTLGVNCGPRGDTLKQLTRRIRELSQSHGQPVQLVGWSLGGLLARVAADRARQCVSRVVALGSPLSGDPRCTRLGPLFSAVSGRNVKDRELQRMLHRSFNVPVVSVYSRSDGVVGWQASAHPRGKCESIEVESSHLGMVVNPDVLDVVRRVLSRPASAFDATPMKLRA